jgi:hypothetical protein
MNPLKNLFGKVFDAPASQGAPKEDAAFEWNPEEETVAPTSARSASWKRDDKDEPAKSAEAPVVSPAPAAQFSNPADTTVVDPVMALPRPSWGDRPAVAVDPVATAKAPAAEQTSAIESWKKPGVVDAPLAPPEPSPVLAGSPNAVIPLSDFEDVYRKAGIKSPIHGYGVERVYRLLTSRRLVGLDRNVRRSALLTALDAAGVPASDVSQDAVLRRKALAAYEAEKALELQSLRSRNESRVEALQDTVETFTRQKQSQIERLAQGSTSAVRAQSDLEIRKRMEQDRLFRSLAYFVEPLPTPGSETRRPFVETVRPSERFEATIETRALPVPEPAEVVSVSAATAEITPPEIPAAVAVSPEVPAVLAEPVTLAPPSDAGSETAPISQSGLEMALRAAAQEARQAGWGQTVIAEDGAGDAVDALRKLRETQNTDEQK